MTDPIRAQVLLYDAFDPLDVVAPYEVLHAGGHASGGALTVELVSAEGPREVMSGVSGLSMRATGTLDPTADLIVMPGVAGPLDDPQDLGLQTIPMLIAQAADSTLPGIVAQALTSPHTTLATVCGGSLVLAMAGHLDGRNVVTHHGGMEVLQATGATAIQARVVDDGDVISGGGVTSGLDLGLHLVDRFLGSEIAIYVERLFEHERRGIVWRAGGVPHAEVSNGSGEEVMQPEVFATAR